MGSDSNFLLGLSDDEMADGRDVISAISKMPLTVENTNWRPEMDKLSVTFPKLYTYTFAAFVAVVLVCILP